MTNLIQVNAKTESVDTGLWPENILSLQLFKEKFSKILSVINISRAFAWDICKITVFYYT